MTLFKKQNREIDKKEVKKWVWLYRVNSNGYSEKKIWIHTRNEEDKTLLLEIELEHKLILF